MTTSDHDAAVRAIESAFDSFVADIFKVLVNGIIDNPHDHETPLSKFDHALDIARAARTEAVKRVTGAE